MLGKCASQHDQVWRISTFRNRKGEAWLDRQRRYGVRSRVLERLWDFRLPMGHVVLVYGKSLTSMQCILFETAEAVSTRYKLPVSLFTFETVPLWLVAYGFRLYPMIQNLFGSGSYGQYILTNVLAMIIMAPTYSTASTARMMFQYAVSQEFRLLPPNFSYTILYTLLAIR